MQKLILALLLASALMMSGCSENTAKDISEIKHEIYEIQAGIARLAQQINESGQDSYRNQIIVRDMLSNYKCDQKFEQVEGSLYKKVNKFSGVR